LDNDLLFGNITQKLASPAHRVLKSNNAEQVQLTLPGNRHVFAERLDSDVLKASLDAEKRIKSFREPAWSIALSKARRKKVILKKWLTMHRIGLDHAQIIRRDMEAVEIEMPLPTSKQQCNSMMREVQSEIDKIVAQSFQQRDDQERDSKIQELENSLRHHKV
jgi:hypothetical protein